MMTLSQKLYAQWRAVPRVLAIASAWLCMLLSVANPAWAHKASDA